MVATRPTRSLILIIGVDMELTNGFTVPYQAGTVWRVLGDPHKVAHCLPEAVIESQEENLYRGLATVAVGPISLALKGTLTVVERNDSHHWMRLQIGAQERYGQGTVEATMLVSASPAQGRTDVKVTATVHLSGKIAQFSAPLIESMSKGILTRFVQNLHSAADAEASALEES
jgi:carbon monoxide dehydrogenase subunit G